MTFTQFIIDYWQYIIPALISCCFFVVNIIQAVRTHNASKLKELICRIPEIIRKTEQLCQYSFLMPDYSSTTAATDKSALKKATAETLIKCEVGEKFFKKHIKVIDDAIEDILDTPQKKGGSIDGISKENEER